MKVVAGLIASCVFLMVTCAPLLAQESGRDRGDMEKRITAIESCVAYPVTVKDQPSNCQTLENQMKALHVPGVSIAIIHHGVIEWAKGFGVARADGDLVNTGTLFQAGSISKPVSAIAALHLVQKGTLSLDADVNDRLQSWEVPPGPFTSGSVVTLRELLTHTSGLNVHGFPGYAVNTPIPSLVEVLNGEKPANTEAVRLESKPGSEWKYSGGGFTVMQLLLQDVTKQPFALFLRDTVLDPIGMHHSTFEQPLPTAYDADAAAPYDASGSPLAGGAHIYPEQAAAGLWTTPSDLAQFIIEIQQSLRGKANHVINQAMTRNMLTQGKGDWGLGIKIGGSPANPYFEHDGSDAGFESIMMGYENTGDGAVIMTNGQNGGLLLDRILASIAIAYGWPDLQPKTRVAVKLDKSVLMRYLGTYEFSPGYNVIITLGGDHLVCQFEDGPAFVMYAESRTKFFTLENLHLEFPSPQDKQVGYVLTQSENSKSSYRWTRK